MEKYAGNDNYGRPKSEYLNRLKEMDDIALQKETEKRIWLSAYAANNTHSDFHWQCNACLDECISRDKLSIYQLAFKKAF